MADRDWDMTAAIHRTPATRASLPMIGSTSGCVRSTLSPGSRHSRVPHRHTTRAHPDCPVMDWRPDPCLSPDSTPWTISATLSIRTLVSRRPSRPVPFKPTFYHRLTLPDSAACLTECITSRHKIYLYTRGCGQ